MQSDLTLHSPLSFDNFYQRKAIQFYKFTQLKSFRGFGSTKGANSYRNIDKIVRQLSPVHIRKGYAYDKVKLCNKSNRK